ITSPLLRISTGSFFSGWIFEYSSLGVPGATAAGVNSILSISPSSIAAMRTLRANGEAGEKVSFMACPSVIQTWQHRHCEERSDEAIQSLPDSGLLRFARNDGGVASVTSRRDDLLALLAETVDAERDDI